MEPPKWLKHCNAATPRSDWKRSIKVDEALPSSGKPLPLKSWAEINGCELVYTPSGVGRGTRLERRAASQPQAQQVSVVRALATSCAAADAQEEMATAVAAGGGAWRRPRKLEPQNEDVVPGEAPTGSESRSSSSSNSRRLIRPIAQHPVPAYLRQLVERQDRAAVERQLGRPAGKALSSVHKYAKRLKLLLWLEELQQEIDIRQYDMRGQTMDPTKGGSSNRLWLQVLKVLPASSLLLVAPSNSAADQLFQRLRDAGHPLSEMLRICAYARSEKDLPPDMDALRGSRCLNWDARVGAFVLPGRERLVEARLRVVVTTCATAAMMYHAGVAPGRFSHVFVDDAGHAAEPLVLAAMAGLQLGPIVLSPLARAHGLDVSLLERLAGGEPYARREGGQQPPYQTPYTTMLLDNYRSHLCTGRRCPTRGHPCCSTTSSAATCSPSWCNPDEVMQVAMYMKQLRDLKRNPIADGDIGVISPYRKHVQRIRAILATTDRSIKVGSVEEFQGQERRVIIISTVRSSSQHLALDSKDRLGFLSNPKRFNVAITRAKELLVVVGNAEVLAADPHWYALLRFLQSKGAITGQSLPPSVREQLEAEPAAAEEGAAGAAAVRGSAVGGLLAVALQQLAAVSGDGRRRRASRG
ncbi:putative helicase [Tetrabaena socialis]|uniref:Putative helicase n=1 Tax=Tetrabaena socialis TaxID=47790 RepID=A0A2J8ABW2_9CHLO|nr:putative helicase [Tetrabaena socialis]|eukprot:PNH10015.1 putative helicase [Tetrabaena socialis]